MNLLDLFIAVILGLFVALGCFKGVWSSLIALGNYILSFLGAALCVPVVAGWFHASGLTAEVLKYAEGAEKLGSYALSVQPVSAFSPEQLTQLVQGTGLPQPMDRLLAANLTNQAYGADATLGVYFNNTIAYTCINLLSFVILFFIFRILLGIITGALSYANILPVRSQRSLPLVGAGVGFLRGVILLFVLFLLVPILLSVFPEAVQTLLNSSLFGRFFFQSNFLFAFIGSA